MIISIINRSAGALEDEDLQQAIRAVNRQIAEDFEPYWSMGATLRLEGHKGGGPQSASDMRGDAILYVSNKADVADALGYHERNNHGIPYGFVFLDVAKEVEEDWRVTLSHEALEMIADPEVNLLVQGPHPEDPERQVFHWYEVCDAVQAESYVVDGVPVSNFVLPLYFTSEAEPGGRNDFLGRRYKGRSLQSFGVNPGGYIGFFDPEEKEHVTFAPDPEAKRRMGIKYRVGKARRAVRRELPQRRGGASIVVTPAAARAQASAGVTPQLESIVLTLRRREGQRRQAQELVQDLLGERWIVDPFGDGQLEARPLDAPPPAGEAWERVRALRARAEVESAEPLFAAHVCLTEQPEDTAPRPPALRASGGSGPHLPEAEQNPVWSLEAIRAFEAWDLVRAGGGEPGAGVLIGHPDTGYTNHPELWGAGGHQPLRIDLGFDFVRNDPGAEDELESSGFIPSPGHGTRTGSVIVSPPGPPPGRGGARVVTGVAPLAQIVPLRTARSVVVFSTRNLTLAIRRAADVGCRVISISMGGLGSGALHDAVRYAVSKGAIVVTAAGNEVGFVVWPARYEEALAVAASNVRDEPWQGSSHGSAVDITAPGESVWRGDTKRDGAVTIFDVGMGRGTSFATATTAGAAAVWLGHHAARLQLLPPDAIAPLFRALVQQTARRPRGWNTSEYGPGILDLFALLRAQIPTNCAAPVHARRVRRAAASAPKRTPALLDELAPGFPLAGPARALRGRRAAAPPATADDLREELTFWACVTPALREALRGRKRRGAAKRRGRAAAAGDDVRDLLLGCRPSAALVRALG
ncbi:MAG: S8 family serine peptidase [Vicinamibacteria bacterium]